MGWKHVWMRPCALRIVAAASGAKATSLDTGPIDHAPWRMTAPAALSTHIKPLIWSNPSSGPARVEGCGVLLEQRRALDRDGGSD